jgi:hypothetical protein
MQKKCRHRINKVSYLQYIDKVERNLMQRQCLVCLKWFFYGQYGKGWQSAKIQATSQIVLMMAKDTATQNIAEIASEG